MAPKSQNIDVEWAESLIGLRLSVPEHWWLGLKGNELHDGKLESFDASTQKWILSLDHEPDDPCPMAHTAIHACADQEASTCGDCNLPHPAVLEGVEEEVAVQNKTHEVTPSNKWKETNNINDQENDNTVKVMEPVPWTGESKEFTVNATPEEIKSFKDEQGEISFCNILMW